jgi:hypothetical protein
MRWASEGGQWLGRQKANGSQVRGFHQSALTLWNEWVPVDPQVLFWIFSKSWHRSEKTQRNDTQRWIGLGKRHRVINFNSATPFLMRRRIYFKISSRQIYGPGSPFVLSACKCEIQSGDKCGQIFLDKGSDWAKEESSWLWVVPRSSRLIFLGTVQRLSITRYLRDLSNKGNRTRIYWLHMSVEIIRQIYLHLRLYTHTKT